MSLHNHKIPTAQDVLKRYKHLPLEKKVVHLANIIHLLYIHEKNLLKENEYLISKLEKGGKNEHTRATRKTTRINTAA